MQGCSTLGLWARSGLWSCVIQPVGLPTGLETWRWGSSGSSFRSLAEKCMDHWEPHEPGTQDLAESTQGLILARWFEQRQ